MQKKYAGGDGIETIAGQVNDLNDNFSDWLGESIICNDSNGTYEEGSAEDFDNKIEATTMTVRK